MKHRSADSNETVESDGAALDSVTERETIADCVDITALEERLPPGWNVSVELVQFGEEPLGEVLVVHSGTADSKLLCRPLETVRPNDGIELYERASPADTRELLTTVESLSVALRTAINWTHQRS